MKKIMILFVLGFLPLVAISYIDIPKVQGASFKYDDMDNTLRIKIPFPFPLGNLNLDVLADLTTVIRFESDQIKYYATYLHFWTIDDKWYYRSYDHDLKFLVNDTLRFGHSTSGSHDYATFTLST